MMDRGIQLLRIWSDDDVVELRVTVANGASRFVNQVYVGHQHLADTISELETFKDHVLGGILDLRFGEFGCESSGPWKEAFQRSQSDWRRSERE
jgi:hypothetical protein